MRGALLLSLMACAGAGISDWMTSYVNTDVHPFIRQYLEATPWDDPEIYDNLEWFDQHLFTSDAKTTQNP